MDEQSKTYTLEVKRIVVALDASTDSLAALRSAAVIAAALEAELVGLFVEDENLVRFAGLPFAREYQRATGRNRSVDPPDIEKDMSLQAARARRALAEIARQAEARWRFEVVRGAVTQEILKAGMEADLLSLGRTSRPLFRGLRLGSTAREAIGRSAQSIFLARSGGDGGGPIHVIFDGSPAGMRALVAAARIARINDTSLTVLLPPDGGENGETAADLAEQVQELIGGQEEGPDIEVHKLPAGGEQGLQENIKEWISKLQRKK